MKLTKDQASVLLDAIAIAQHQADATNFQPWNDYDADPYDDKTDRLGWFQLLDEATETLKSIVGGE